MISMKVERILHIISFFIGLCTVGVIGVLFFLQQQASIFPVQSVSETEEQSTGTRDTIAQAISDASTTPPVSSPRSIPDVLVPTPVPEKTVVAPEPLIIRKDVPPDIASANNGAGSAALALNEGDIVRYTNDERASEGLLPLSINRNLTAIAKVKAADMIEKQYFAHVSPSGVDVADLSEVYGYHYLNIGENLALGDFVSSREVVTGWMNSPGHRANIMNKSYKEIGVAALVGKYEGYTVWFAVQEFGRPLSDCPLPDPLLEKKITIFEDELAKLEMTLNSLKTQMETPGTSAESYNIMVDDFNTIAELYNGLLATTKEAIVHYNAEAKRYNDCVGS